MPDPGPMPINLFKEVWCVVYEGDDLPDAILELMPLMPDPNDSAGLGENTTLAYEMEEDGMMRIFTYDDEAAEEASKLSGVPIFAKFTCHAFMYECGGRIFIAESEDDCPPRYFVIPKEAINVVE
jgi:hypothetical protein